MRWWKFLLFSGYMLPLFSQPLFQPAELRELRSGLVMAMADMNGDRLTDLVRLENGIRVVINYQVSGKPGFYEQVLDDLLERSAWCLTIGDVDRNGYNDILAGGNHDGITYWQMGTNGTILHKTALEGGFEIYAQAANLTDINNDGWLDYFVCNDEGWNFIYMNDGTGQLIKQDSIINFKTLPESDFSGNYGSIWTDFDQDGDLDLYLSKCKASATSPADPRRINRLFVNQGKGLFVDKAVELGLASGAQTWISEVADLDNDGDYDFIIFNHDRPAEFFRNDKGVFVDLSDSIDLRIQGLIIQGLCRDLDNDGLLDIVIGGQAPYLIKNLGQFKFQPSGQLPTVENITSLSVGDLNGDGYQDVYASHARDFVSPGGTPDELFLALPDTNHWIDFHLEGTLSNPAGAGAQVEIFGPWGKQIREQRVGESYGITSSTALLFGLGTFTGIDSVRVSWPSGLKEVYRSLASNQKYTLVENTCITTPQALSIKGDRIICGDDTVTISTDDNRPGWVWNTGDTTNSLQVTKQTGLYFAKRWDERGCPLTTENIFIQYNPEFKQETTITPDTLVCEGVQVYLTLPEGNQYLWNTGDTMRTLIVEKSGVYSGSSKNKCNQYQSGNIQVQSYSTVTPTVTDAVLKGPGSAILHAEGDSIHWYADAQATQLLGTGQRWETPINESSTNYYAVNLSKKNRGEFNFGEPAPNTEMHTNSQFNGRMFFSVLQDLWLDSITVYTDIPGRRTIEIYNADTLYYQKIFELKVGKNQLAMFCLLAPSPQYFITTNRQTNISNFGITSPQLFRSVGKLSYPYTIAKVISLFRNNFNLDEYYYFFDWKLRLPPLYCSSEPVCAKVLIKTTASDRLNALNKMELFPNPVQERLYWNYLAEHEEENNFSWTVFNSQGQLVSQGQGLAPISVVQWPAGLYFMHVITHQKTTIYKVVKN